MTELSVDRLRRRWSRRLAIFRMADDVLKLSDLRTAGGCIGRRCAHNKYDARNQGCALIPIHVSFLLQGTLLDVHRASTLRRPRLGSRDIKALRGSSIKLGFRKIDSNLFGDAASNYNGKQGRLVALQGPAIDKGTLDRPSCAAAQTTIYTKVSATPLVLASHPPDDQYAFREEVGR